MMVIVGTFTWFSDNSEDGLDPSHSVDTLGNLTRADCQEECQNRITSGQVCRSILYFVDSGFPVCLINSMTAYGSDRYTGWLSKRRRKKRFSSPVRYHDVSVTLGNREGEQLNLIIGLAPLKTLWVYSLVKVLLRLVLYSLRCVSFTDRAGPEVVYCPDDVKVTSVDKSTNITWEEPLFNNARRIQSNYASGRLLNRDDIILNNLLAYLSKMMINCCVSVVHYSGLLFTWGEHQVIYVAESPSLIKSYCKFKVIVSCKYSVYCPTTLLE